LSFTDSTGYGIDLGRVWKNFVKYNLRTLGFDFKFNQKWGGAMLTVLLCLAYPLAAPYIAPASGLLQAGINAGSFQDFFRAACMGQLTSMIAPIIIEFLRPVWSTAWRYLQAAWRFIRSIPDHVEMWEMDRMAMRAVERLNPISFYVRDLGVIKGK
jgi:hypothetical protein